MALSLPLTYALIPWLAMAIGAGVVRWRPPGPNAKSVLAHFAAGVVFSVAAVELLPELRQDLAPAPLALSFSVGVAFMLGIERLTHTQGARDRTGGLPWGLLSAIAVDVALDGMLLGLGFEIGRAEGLLLTLALTLEGLTLGMALASSLTGASGSPSRSAGLVAGVGLLFPFGAIIGAQALSGAGRQTIGMVIAFGLAALLFLVTEELLVEAHEHADSPVATTMFFVGFLLFLILGMVL